MKVQVTIYHLSNFRLEAIESSLKNSAEESNKRVVESEVNSKQKIALLCYPPPIIGCLLVLSIDPLPIFSSGEYCGESGQNEGRDE